MSVPGECGRPCPHRENTLCREGEFSSWQLVLWPVYSGMHILIADDNRRIREVIKTVLARTGATFSECENGSDAVDVYRRERPDWVLMDIVMERTDGLVATRQITSVFPEARVLIVTNYNAQDLREAAEDAGAKGYILKDNLSEIETFLTAHG